MVPWEKKYHVSKRPAIRGSNYQISPILKRYTYEVRTLLSIITRAACCYFVYWSIVKSKLIEFIFDYCRVLDVSVDQLRENFEVEASDVTKNPSRYARNFLEYSCFRALAQSTQVSGYMEDKRFRRLTFDMMLAWEVPDASSQPTVDVCMFICYIEFLIVETKIELLQSLVRT